MAKNNKQTKSEKNKDQDKVGSSQSKILKKLAQRMTEDYHPNHNYSNLSKGLPKDPEVQKINRMISNSAQKISKKNQDGKKDKESKPSFSPEKFDGLDHKEERTLLIEKIKHLERENTKFKHELELLHEDFQEERANLKKNIRELKSELHRTAPLTDNKLFSFSKELRHVASTVQALSDQEKELFSINNSKQNQETEFEQMPPPKVSIQKPLSNDEDEKSQIKKITKPQTNDEDNKSKQNKEDKSKPKNQTNKINLSKQQKVLGGSTAAVLILLLGIGAIFSNDKRIENKIIEEQMNKEEQGQVQGASANPGTPAAQIQENNRYNEISFDQAKWEIFRDEFIGFQVRYPSNAVDLLHTGNTITFLRYDAYLYKAQRISTKETLMEYFERTEKDRLDYTVKEEEFRGNNALHLVLEEDVEYPGNKYLVKKSDYIYDIWYATQSAHFKQSDMEFVNRMLETTRVLVL